VIIQPGADLLFADERKNLFVNEDHHPGCFAMVSKFPFHQENLQKSLEKEISARQLLLNIVCLNIFHID